MRTSTPSAPVCREKHVSKEGRVSERMSEREREKVKREPEEAEAREALCVSAKSVVKRAVFLLHERR